MDELYEKFYGSDYELLKKAEEQILECVRQFEKESGTKDGKAVQYCKSRIKSPESAVEKLKRKGVRRISPDAVLAQLHDIVGVRVVCSFVNDVYQTVQWIKEQEAFRIIEEKDYYECPKPNGYRSYHMILTMVQGPGKGVTAEIQIRTIATDFWASLEHQMKYKQEIQQEKLIRSELKNCADEIASVDLSMQTLKELIVRCGK